MTSLTPRQGQFGGTTMREMKWSPTEKVIARKAFDLALGREVTLEARSKAAKIQEPSNLWDLEQYLTQRRQEIDRTFDYRYSLLPLVFANILRSGRLVEEELRGLGEDKLACIHRASVHL